MEALTRRPPESTLIKNYVSRFGQGKITLSTAKCPSDVAQKTGGSYSCKVVVQEKANAKQHAGTITVHMVAGNKVAIFGARDVDIR